MPLTLTDLTLPRALARTISQSSPGVSRWLWGSAMAGDWIPMRCDLTDDPAVIGIAADLEIPESHVVGLLHRVWSWASCQTVDGNAPTVTFAFLNRYVGVTGFAEAMEHHGWLCRNGDGLAIPHFDRHNSESAKARARTRIRVQKHRNAPSVTKALPQNRTEQNRKENPKEDSPPAAPPEKPVKREPNPWWDAVVAVFFAEGVPDDMRSQVGKLAAGFKKLGATEDEIRKRRARIRDAWGPGTDTARSVLKHWGEFTEDARPSSGKHQDSPARVRAKPGKYDNLKITRIDNFAKSDGKNAE